MIEWSKDIVTWRDGKTLYMSVVFTWQLEEAERIASEHKGSVVKGGPAVALKHGADYCGGTPFDVLAMHNPLATFTTRGCPRSCSFCAVPKIEGEFRELPDFKPAPIVCDNNFLAASRKHIERVVECLKPFNHIDFNQGLDARLFKPWHMELFQSLKGLKLRFAFDHIRQERALARAIDLVRKAGFTAKNSIGVYVLIGFKDTPDDALHRLEWIRSQGYWPNPMRYQPLDAEKKNEFVAPGWTSTELKRMMRYYSRLRWLEHIPYQDFEYEKAAQVDMFGDDSWMQGSVIRKSINDW